MKDIIMEVKDLIGLHRLSAVDRIDVEPNPEVWRSEKAEHVTFVLDGMAYTAIEDPSDGYRSSMAELRVTSGYKPTNTFEPVDVYGIYVNRGSGYGSSSDIIRLYDIKTNLVVLEIGTNNDDDYYPSFVADFRPENMIINLKKAS